MLEVYHLLPILRHDSTRGCSTKVLVLGLALVTAVGAQIQTSAPSINSGGVLNGASYSGALAPGGIASVFGDFLVKLPSTAQALPVPTSVSGLSFDFGDDVLAPLFYVSNGQVNLQIPWELAGQDQVAVSAVMNGAVGSPVTVNISPYGPGIFSTNGQGSGQGAILSPSYKLADPSTPAIAGSDVVQIFCTGLGPVTNPPATGSAALSQPLSWTTATPTVTIGGASAKVLFSGLAPGFVGLYQVNAIVPSDATRGSEIPVSISIGGVGSNTVTMAVQAASGPGILQINVTGLPAGVPANVAISSPGGFSTVITASQDLQVPAGTYTIQPNLAPAGKVSYGAYTLQQGPVTIDPGWTSTVDVPYATVIPQTTVIVNQQTAQGVSVAADGSTVSVPTSTQAAQSLSPGDVLAIGITPTTPGGLLRKIVSLTQSGQQIVATTKQATLLDAFPQSAFAFSGPITAHDSAVVANGSDIRIVRRLRSLKTAAATPAEASETCTSDTGIPIEMFNTPIVDDDNGSVTVSGEIDICPSYNFNWNFDLLAPISLTGSITLTQTAHLSFAGDYTYSFDKKISIPPIVGDPVAVGPVVLTPIIQFFIGASGDVGGSFSFGASETGSATGGVSYQNGQWSPVTQPPTVSFTPDPTNVDASASAKAYAGAAIGLNIEGVATTEFSPDVFVELSANPLDLSSPWWTLTAGIECPVSIDVSIFGLVNLGNHELGDVFDYSTVVAQASGGFQPPNYTLTVNESGHGTAASTDGTINCANGGGACSASYASGTTVTLNANAASGWTFQGWSGACNGSNPCTVAMNSNLSATATFTQNAVNYTLTVNESGQGTVTSTDGKINCANGGGACSASYASGSNVTLNANAASGWTLQGWSGPCSGGNPCTVAMNSNLSATATFTQNAVNYTLTVNESGQGTVTSTDGKINCANGGGTCSASYASGTNVTLNANAASGWTLQGWSGPCSGGNPCTVAMNSNLSATATFTQNAVNYTLTVNESGQGTVTSTDGKINCANGGGTCSASYASGTNVTLNANAANGWTLQGWSGACSGGNPCTVTMNSNLSATATFTQNAVNYTLTVNESGQGTVTSTDGKINCANGGGTCSASYASGTNVTLNANAASGWTLQGWSGACSGGNPCTVTMNSNLSATATFTQNAVNYTLTVNESGQGTVTSTDGKINCANGGGTCSASYASGSSVTLNANAASGWTFQGWSGACNG